MQHLTFAGVRQAHRNRIDVWVGREALILPAVRIGSRLVIGAGSVATRDIPAFITASSAAINVCTQINIPDDDGNALKTESPILFQVRQRDAYDLGLALKTGHSGTDPCAVRKG